MGQTPKNESLLATTFALRSNTRRHSLEIVKSVFLGITFCWSTYVHFRNEHEDVFA